MTLVITWTLLVWECPGLPSPAHPMASGGGTTSTGSYTAYSTESSMTKHVTTRLAQAALGPIRADSYILMSAGFDGEYGTKDDIYNFSD